MTWIIILTMLFLVAYSVLDIRTRTIPFILLVAGIAAGVVISGYRLYLGTVTIWGMLFALSPGVFMVAISLLCRQQIGYADGMAVMMLGLLAGSTVVYLALIVGLLLSSLWAAGLLATHRGTRQSHIPWLPFLTVGYAIVLLIR